MHSTTHWIDGHKWEMNHNGDYSGDVFFYIETYHPERKVNGEDRVEFIDNSAQREKMKPLIHAPDDMESDGYTVSIPFELLKKIVAAKLRMDIIERFEDMDADELLATRVNVSVDL
jgi:hypothetical protein